MRGNVFTACFLMVACLGYAVQGFIAPGVAPEDYVNCEHAKVWAVKLTSTRTQLPYEYYSLPFCKPTIDVMYKTENLGEVLRGDRIVNTPFQFRVNRNDSCKILCQSQKLSVQQQTLLYKRIMQEYQVHLLTDNLPVATPYVGRSGNSLYEHGYRLGMVNEGEVSLHNHLEFTVKFHHNQDDTFRIVGFEVHPKSLSNEELLEDTEEPTDKCPPLSVPSLKNCKRPSGKSNNDFRFFTLSEKPKGEITVNFTYSLVWEPSDLQWASRWDIYLSMSNAQIHWFSILNSLVVIFVLAGVLAAIIIRILKKDIAAYNKLDDEEVGLEESGWKSVRRDVFRPPRFHMLLSALIGSGVQLFGLTSLVIVVAMLGMISPASRGTLMTSGILVYVFMGLCGRTSSTTCLGSCSWSTSYWWLPAHRSQLSSSTSSSVLRTITGGGSHLL